MGRYTVANNLSKRHIGCIIWDDAHMNMDEFTQDEIDKDIHKPARVYSFGLILKSDAVGVTLGTDEDEHHIVRKVNFIPRAMIVEEVDLGIPKRKGERKRREKAVVDPSPDNAND